MHSGVGDWGKLMRDQQHRISALMSWSGVGAGTGVAVAVAVCPDPDAGVLATATWTHSSQHTSRTDLAPTERGPLRGRLLRQRLTGRRRARRLTSPDGEPPRFATSPAERWEDIARQVGRAGLQRPRGPCHPRCCACLAVVTTAQLAGGWATSVARRSTRGWATAFHSGPIRWC